MRVVKVGIASYEAIKERTMKIARGELQVSSNDPKIWFPSMQSFAQILSDNNRALLRTIIKNSPNSLEDLAGMTGREKSNLSRTLKTLENYGIITLEKDARGRIKPRAIVDRFELDIDLACA